MTSRLFHAFIIAVVFGFAAWPARAEERLAVIVGSNLGDPAEEPLRYAESDASRVRDLLISLGGVRADRAILVSGTGGPDQVLRALGEAQGRAAELAAAGKRVFVIFYYSGHGDEGSLHLAGGHLSVGELRRVLGGITADLRVTFLDACRTGTSQKGVARGPAFALAAMPDAPRGTVEIQASSQGELAQESDELGGSIFTHYLTSGLRGDADADRDGQVTLSELYSYAYRRTLLRSGSGTALQHPALALRLEGSGDVVLSTPARAGAFLEVPPGADRTLVFAQPTATVMGELSGDRAPHLALPPGRFLVVRRTGARTSVAEIDLTWGGTRLLTEAEFHTVSREELARRGGHLELRTRHIDPRIGVEIAPGSAEQPAWRTGVSAGWTHGTLGQEIDLFVVSGGLRTPRWGGRQLGVGIVPQLALRTTLGRAAFALLVGLDLRWVRQSLLHDDADRLRSAGFMVEEESSHLAIGPRLGLRAGIALGGHATATLETTATGLIRRELDSAGQTQVRVHPVFATTAGVSYAF